MFLYLCLVCFLISTVNTSVTGWEDCGGQDAILKINSVDLDDPIKIGKKDPIRITMNATQETTISGESRVNIKIFKNQRILGLNLPIRVPCINGIGSCEMSLCEVFKVHRKLVCAILEAANQECKCPSEPGNYVVKDVKYSLNFGIFPTALLAIGNGDYSLDMRITHDEKELACLKLETEVKFV